MIVTPSNSVVRRFSPSNLVDHLEVHEGGKVIAAYAPQHLLDELEENGWYTQSEHLSEEETTLALGWFAIELDQACEYNLW